MTPHINAKDGAFAKTVRFALNFWQRYSLRMQNLSLTFETYLDILASIKECL